MENIVIKYLTGELTAQERAAMEQMLTCDSAEYAEVVAGKQVLALAGYAYADDKDEETGKSEYTRFLEKLSE